MNAGISLCKSWLMKRISSFLDSNKKNQKNPFKFSLISFYIHNQGKAARLRRAWLLLRLRT